MSLALPSRLRPGVDLSPPAEFADAVEQYARRSNRHGRLRFVPPPVNCWTIEFTLMANDPARRAMQAQDTDEQTEIVYLWRPSTPVETSKAGRQHLVGYKLDELGVTGMLEFLEKTDTFSGRGQYRSHAEAAKDQAYKGEKAREALVNEQRENTRHLAEDARRQIFKIPYKTVGIDFTAPESAPAKE